MPVARSGGVTLHCPKDGRYSFYNSPYPAHHLMTGLDIYPNTTKDVSATSPVDGEILQIRHVKAPRGHDFEAPEHDTVTIIASIHASERTVKILHVDTTIKVGQMIHTGQILGSMIRSGYFGYQTPLHAHVEVRPPKDPIRVRGGYPMNSLLDLEKLETTEELIGTVIVKRKGYTQIQLPQKNPWVVVDIGGNPGIIDGGLPLYGWFGAHVKDPKKGAPVSLLGKQIGIVTKTSPRSCVADCTEFTAYLGSTPVDLFFTLTPQQRSTLIATSKNRDEINVRKREEISITVS
jgi:hypothetical protein